MSGVVIVDDQSVNRKVLSLLAATLEPGMRVEAFADPLEAISYSRAQTPDLLVTDFKMPTLNGAELISQFRALPDCRTVPAIVVTAYEDVKFRNLALQAGANEFVLSPLNHIDFCAQSRRLLDMRYTEQMRGILRPPDGQANDASSRLDRSHIGIYNRLIENVSETLIRRVNELQRVNAELTNLLELNATPAIFVDENLLIRRFTAQIVNVYKVAPTDIGSPLSDLVCRLVESDILAAVQQAIRTGDPIERYLEHKTLRSRYLLRVTPSHSENNRALGAMLIFTKVAAPPTVHATSRVIH